MKTVRSFPSLAALALLLASSTSWAGILVSNVGGSSAGSTTVLSDIWYAAKFVAGSTAELTSVDIVIDSIVGAPDANLIVQIWSDSANAPGGPLNTLSGSNPAAPGIYNYTGTFTLTAGASYWLTLSTNASDPSGYAWRETPDGLDGTSQPGWEIAQNTRSVSFNQGGLWQTLVPTTYTLQFAVNGEVGEVPAPGTLALVALGGLLGARLRLRRSSAAKGWPASGARR